MGTPGFPCRVSNFKHNRRDKGQTNLITLIVAVATAGCVPLRGSKKIRPNRVPARLVATAKTRFARPLVWWR
jgi:hypothetical protein